MMRVLVAVAATLLGLASALPDTRPLHASEAHTAPPEGAAQRDDLEVGALNPEQ